MMILNVKVIVGDEIKFFMVDNEVGVVVIFFGEVVEMLSENEDLEYVILKDGLNLWFDNMVILKMVKNVDGVYKFINFMLKLENVVINVEYVGYVILNVKVVELLLKEILSDECFYLDMDELNNLEVYDNFGK